MLHSNAVRERDTTTVRLADEQLVVRTGVRAPTMRTLEINGSQWRSQKDFYDALTDLLGGVERHCRSCEVFLDTMIYYPGLNMEQPPYEVLITNSPAALRPFLFEFACDVAKARQDRWTDPKWGDDVGVVITVG